MTEKRNHQGPLGWELLTSSTLDLLSLQTSCSEGKSFFIIEAILVATDIVILILCYMKEKETFKEEMRSRGGECDKHSIHLYTIKVVKTQRMKLGLVVLYVHKD